MNISMVHNTYVMENILKVPEKTFRSEIKAVFDNKKRAMSPNWVIYSIFYGVLFGLMISAVMGFLLEELSGSVVGYAAFMGFVAFLVQFYLTWIFRDKIIDDMEAAKPYEGTYGFRGYAPYLGSTYVTIVPTMAGELKLTSFEKSIKSEFLIKKKAGQLFNYYEFPNVKGIDRNDLSIFIAVPNDLD